jgi:23S rRNA (uracil1939-C5)-methyltransferase
MRSRPPSEPLRARVLDLTHEGHGVARVDGKVTFIDGALPGEEVLFQYERRRGRFDEGRVVEVLEPSSDRVPPRCPHFETCGGCSLQHLASEAQVRFKQARLLSDLQHMGRVEPGAVLDPVVGPAWGYRRKARLSARFLRREGRLQIGFRERRSQRLAELSRCEVMDPRVGPHLEALRAMLDSLSVRDQVPQVEVAAGDDDAAIVVRHLAPLSAADRARLRAFGEAHGLQVFSQPRGPDSVTPVWPAEPRPLRYRLAEWGVELEFRPTDFTQVNAAINPGMVRLALDLLGAGRDDRVLDLYAGLGNFTLPLARVAGQVVGVEGDPALVARARENAARNALANVELHVANLGEALSDAPWFRPPATRLVLDPPRCGAEEVVRGLAPPLPGRVVYVSCNPETLARDAGELVRGHGYRLVSAGILDMFPHTAHVESIALFERR